MKPLYGNTIGLLLLTVTIEVFLPGYGGGIENDGFLTGWSL